MNLRRSQRFCVYGVDVERSLEEGHYMLPSMSYCREMVSGLFPSVPSCQQDVSRGGTLS